MFGDLRLPLFWPFGDVILFHILVNISVWNVGNNKKSFACFYSLPSGIFFNSSDILLLFLISVIFSLTSLSMLIQTFSCECLPLSHMHIAHALFFAHIFYFSIFLCQFLSLEHITSVLLLGDLDKGFEG